MALPKKKKEAIKKDAQEKAAKIPDADKQAEFEKKYQDIVLKLNERIDGRLDKFVSTSIPLLREAYQFRPQSILSVLKQQEERLRTLTQEVISVLEPILNVGFRNEAGACLKDLIDICLESMNVNTAEKLGEIKNNIN